MMSRPAEGLHTIKSKQTGGKVREKGCYSEELGEFSKDVTEFISAPYTVIYIRQFSPVLAYSLGKASEPNCTTLPF